MAYSLWHLGCCRTEVVDITDTAVGRTLKIERDVGDVTMCSGTLAELLQTKDTVAGRYVPAFTSLNFIIWTPAYLPIFMAYIMSCSTEMDGMPCSCVVIGHGLMHILWNIMRNTKACVKSSTSCTVTYFVCIVVNWYECNLQAWRVDGRLQLAQHSRIGASCMPTMQEECSGPQTMTHVVSMFICRTSLYFGL